MAPPARPLFRPAPRSAMVFPLVVLVAVLPGLLALNAWDLTPPGPLWGLRGLAVLDGMVLDQVPASAGIRPVQEAAAYRAVAFQPPLYAWLEAALFWLDGNRDPMASVLPSYVAGGLAVVLVYLHARLWRGAGLGLTAAVLVGFNQNLLLRMQEATPSTLALCGVLAVLLAYCWHERVIAESMRPWPWAGPTAWAVVGGLAMGLALLVMGGLALIAIPIVLLHQYYLRGAAPPSPPGARPRRWRLSWRDTPGRVNVLLAPGDRHGRGLALVRPDGPDARLGGHRGAPGSPRAVAGRSRPGPAGPVDRAGARDAPPRPVRGRAGDPHGPGRRVEFARVGRRLVLGHLARGRRAGADGLAWRAAERLRPRPARPAEPAGRADDRGPRQSPHSGPHAHLAGAGDGRLGRVVVQRAACATPSTTCSTAGPTPPRPWGCIWRSTWSSSPSG